MIDTTKFTFTTTDYSVFGIMLAVSAGIGIYFGFFDKSANTPEEYLLGSKRMKTIPIAISLVASQLSGIAIMGIPVEIYQYGIHFALTFISLIFILPVFCYVIVPVFYKNNISNCYEYLELRFNKTIRRIITVSFVITIYLMIPVYIFVPALAFSQVTGFNIHLINGIVCSVCVFYTMLGGIKAVVWTDVFQAGIMLGSLILVAVLAVIKVGGFGEVISRAIEGNRIHSFDMTFDPTIKDTFWSCFFGSLIMWISHVGVHQSCVQRMVSLPTLGHSQMSLLIFSVGAISILSVTGFTGIIMFARYYLCDPVKAGIVDKADKLMPFFVQDVIGHLQGIPGVFISCVFSAALSTVSANLNTLAGLVYFDYVKPFINHTEAKANLIMKIIVAVNGVYCVLGGFIVEKFSSILQIAIAIGSMSQGAVSGIFLLGMLYPKAHSKAATIATICSIIILGIMVIGSQILQQMDLIKYYPLATRIEPEACSEFNVTITDRIGNNLIHDKNNNFNGLLTIFKISIFLYGLIGASLVWIIGVPLSHFLKDTEEKKRDINLFSPVIHTFLDEYSPNEEKPLKS